MMEENRIVEAITNAYCQMASFVKDDMSAWVNLVESHVGLDLYACRFLFGIAKFQIEKGGCVCMLPSLQHILSGDRNVLVHKVMGENISLR